MKREEEKESSSQWDRCGMAYPEGGRDDAEGGSPAVTGIDVAWLISLFPVKYIPKAPVRKLYWGPQVHTYARKSEIFFLGNKCLAICAN